MLLISVENTSSGLRCLGFLVFIYLEKTPAYPVARLMVPGLNAFLPPPLNAPPGRVGMKAEIELFPFSSPARKGGVIDFYLAGAST